MEKQENKLNKKVFARRLTAVMLVFAMMLVFTSCNSKKLGASITGEEYLASRYNLVNMNSSTTKMEISINNLSVTNEVLAQGNLTEYKDVINALKQLTITGEAVYDKAKKQYEAKMDFNIQGKLVISSILYVDLQGIYISFPNLSAKTIYISYDTVSKFIKEYGKESIDVKSIAQAILNLDDLESIKNFNPSEYVAIMGKYVELKSDGNGTVKIGDSEVSGTKVNVKFKDTYYTEMLPEILTQIEKDEQVSKMIGDIGNSLVPVVKENKQIFGKDADTVISILSNAGDMVKSGPFIEQMKTQVGSISALSGVASKEMANTVSTVYVNDNNIVAETGNTSINQSGVTANVKTTILYDTNTPVVFATNTDKSQIFEVKLDNQLELLATFNEISQNLLKNIREIPELKDFAK